MAAGGKVHPMRQQMINMMYLVLIAMLALNVSAEVLRAFKLVNDGLVETRHNLESKNAIIYGAFATAMAGEEAPRVAPYNAKAVQARQITDELVFHIDSLKAIIVETSDTTNDGRLKRESDLNFGNSFFLREGRATELRDKIIETRQNLLAILDESQQRRVSLTLEANPTVNREGIEVSWERTMFEEVPLSAIYTLLSKLQNDARNSEGEIINLLFQGIRESQHAFDGLRAIVATNKNLVMLNEQFQAEIFLGAYSTTAQPRIYVDGEQVPVENGMARITRTAQRPGDIPIKGRIEVEGPDGKTEVHEFTQTVQAFAGSATISADAMNVLYAGLENPISISVPGFPPNAINASMSNGNLRKVSDGKYIATVQAGAAREATISVSVNVDGQNRQMGVQNYRIRLVPRPVAYFGNTAGGNISRGELQAVTFLAARLDNFVFDGINYRVTNYTMIYQPRGGTMQQFTGSGHTFTPQIQAALRGANAGDQIIFTNIRAAAPGIGEVPLQGGVVLNVR